MFQIYSFPSPGKEKSPSRLRMSEELCLVCLPSFFHGWFPPIRLQFKLPALGQAFHGRPASNPHSPPLNFSTLLKSAEIKSTYFGFKLPVLKPQTTTLKLYHVKKFCNPFAPQFPRLKLGDHIRDDLPDKVEVLNGLINRHTLRTVPGT